MKSVKDLIRQKKICEIVDSRMVQASSSVTVREAVDLMGKKRSGYVIISDNKKVVGIFTETDLVRRILTIDSAALEKPVGEFMTKDPRVLKQDALVADAIEMMGDHHFYHLPLLDEKGELTAVLSVRTLIRFLAEFYPTEIFNLPPRFDQIMKTREGG